MRLKVDHHPTCGRSIDSKFITCIFCGLAPVMVVDQMCQPPRLMDAAETAHAAGKASAGNKTNPKPSAHLFIFFVTNSEHRGCEDKGLPLNCNPNRLDFSLIRPFTLINLAIAPTTFCLCPFQQRLRGLKRVKGYTRGNHLKLWYLLWPRHSRVLL